MGPPPGLLDKADRWRNPVRPRISFFWLVGPPLQPIEVGLFLGMGCMVPQLYATGGNRLYSEVLGYN
jgi:hypothetical protein